VEDEISEYAMGVAGTLGSGRPTGESGYLKTASDHCSPIFCNNSLTEQKRTTGKGIQPT
jgi:hypothetical protein